MDNLWVYILISEICSLAALYRIWTSKDIFLFKILLSLVAVVPFLGPILYLFASDNTKPQPIELQNRYARGGYTDKVISEEANRKILESELLKLEKNERAKDKT